MGQEWDGSNFIHVFLYNLRRQAIVAPEVFARSLLATCMHAPNELAPDASLPMAPVPSYQVSHVSPHPTLLPRGTSLLEIPSVFPYPSFFFFSLFTEEKDTLLFSLG
jgi:hypothetical protein